MLDRVSKSSRRQSNICCVRKATSGVTTTKVPGGGFAMTARGRTRHHLLLKQLDLKLDAAQGFTIRNTKLQTRAETHTLISNLRTYVMPPRGSEKKLPHTQVEDSLAQPFDVPSTLVTPGRPWFPYARTHHSTPKSREQNFTHTAEFPVWVSYC